MKLTQMWKVSDMNEPESLNAFFFTSKEKAFAMYPKIVEWSKKQDVQLGITAESDWIVEPEMLWIDVEDADFSDLI